MFDLHNCGFRFPRVAQYHRSSVYFFILPSKDQLNQCRDEKCLNYMSFMENYEKYINHNRGLD